MAFFFVLWAGVERSIFFPRALYFLSGLFPNIIGVGAMGATSFVSFSFSCCLNLARCLFFLFGFIHPLAHSLTLYPVETTLFSQFFPFSLSLVVLRDQIPPYHCLWVVEESGGDDNGIGLGWDV